MDYFLPVLSHFQNGNFWTASSGRMRYQVVPDGETLCAQVWEGPWNRNDSPIEEERRFPLAEEGVERLRAWLEEWQQTIDARPPRSLVETLQARDAFRAARELDTPPQ